MDEEEWIDGYFQQKIRSYEYLSKSLLDETKLNLDMSDDELSEMVGKTLPGGPCDSEEEQISFLLSSMKKQALNDPHEFIEDLYNTTKRDIAKRLYPYESNERNRFSSIFQHIRDFTESELDLAGDWLETFHATNDGIAYSQQYNQLVEEDLGRDRKISIDDIDSLEKGRDIYSATMDICDSGYPIPVGLSWIGIGDNPLQKDAVSMGFMRGLQELEGTVFDVLPNHIDTDLRHGIKHGDVVIDPQKEQLRIDHGNQKYPFNDMKTAVNEALLVIDMMQVIDSYVSLVDYRRTFDYLE